MKLHHRYHGGVSLAALSVLLLPLLFPTLFIPLGHASPSLSEWNAPKPRHSRLLKSAIQHQAPDGQRSDLWTPLANQGWKPCVESTSTSALPESHGYIQVFLDGGLNQQRMGICDAVALAKILNATLVVPYLEVNAVWQDSSSFMDIFDLDHFINVLKDDISIVTELPEEYTWSTREYYASAIRATRIKTAPLHASANWYLDNVLPILERFVFTVDSLLPTLAPYTFGYIIKHMHLSLLRGICLMRNGTRRSHSTVALRISPLQRIYYSANWNESDEEWDTEVQLYSCITNITFAKDLLFCKLYGIAAISPFSHRLAFDNMPADIQRLRCKANFEALAFVPHVRALGDALVSRLRTPGESDVVGSKYLRPITDSNGREGAGKFVVLHLRFDKDMAAHSACDFGGGKAERLALAKYRQTIWQGRVLNSQFTDEELRNQGRCPLTPEEIGLLLAALGFDNTTRLYLASHKVYGGEARISTLRKLFPQMEDKKSLTSGAERAQIKGKASLLAAVDYYVSMHSDIFISASPGNMHNAMVGHRTFNNLKTIRPNMALLGQLFLNKSLSWSDFQEAVEEGHINRTGQLRIRKGEQSIYTYPAPDCMCQQD